MKLRKYWREILAIAQRILLELGRRQRSLVLWSIFPIFILLLNATILEERTQLDTAQAYALSTPLTIVGAALFFSCLGGSISTVVAEREQHTLKRLFLSPLSGISYFWGIFLAHSAIGIGQTLVVLTVAVSFGANFPGSPWLAGLIVGLSILSYVGVGFILGTQIARRTEDVNALVATFGVPLLLLGGSFIPATFFPSNLLALAEWNPIYHMNQSLSGVMDARPWQEIDHHFWFLAVFTLIMILGGWLSYRRMLDIERNL